MLSPQTKYYFIFFIFTASAFVVVGISSASALREITNINQDIVALLTPFYSTTVVKNPRQTVKAVYLAAYSASSPAKLNEIIQLIDTTELNAVVIDIKDATGLVLYDSKLPMVRELGLMSNRLRDVEAILRQLHAHHIYVIARQAIFQDPALAEKKPEWAIKNKSKGIWRDRKGLAWVNAEAKEVWQYNLSIAREATRLGFDEINFDYVRFPTDGNLKDAVYAEGATRTDIIRAFFNFSDHNFRRVPARLSVDLFGLVMDKTGDDDLGIGQRLEDAVGHFDYVCPMMYASHYGSGYAGLEHPATDPARVLANGISKGEGQFVGANAEFRPWLQAFNIGAVYDGAKIRAQIDEVEKHPNAGWMLWNASNRYTNAGLK